MSAVSTCAKPSPRSVPPSFPYRPLSHEAKSSPVAPEQNSLASSTTILNSLPTSSAFSFLRASKSSTNRAAMHDPVSPLPIMTTSACGGIGPLELELCGLAELVVQKEGRGEGTGAEQGGRSVGRCSVT